MTINGSTNAQNWTFKLEAYETSYSVSNNTSVVRVDMYLGRSNSQSYLGGDWSGSITVDGQVQYLSGTIDYPTYINAGDWKYLGTKDFTVGHNSDGSKTASVSAEFSSGDFSPSYASASGNLSLTNIPRYASISQSLSSKTETSITMNWSSDSTIDRVWYSTDNGSTWSSAITVNAKSGSYTIENLTADTTYNIKTRVRRKDSQLNSTSSKLSVATYDYPKVSNLVNADFTIGDEITIEFYNPLNRTFTYTIYDNNDNVLETDTISGTSISTTIDSDDLYESIPNKISGNWYVKVVYQSSEKTSSEGTYNIDTSINTPTFENFTYRDSNSVVSTVTGDNQVIVKNLSTLEVTISTANKMVAKNYATGSRYDISCANRSSSETYSSDSAIVSTLGTISSAGSIPINVKAIDSRNLTTTVNKSINVIDYAKPNIVTNVGRVNNFETTTNLSCTGSFSKIVVNNTEKNNISLARFRYKKMSDISYGSWTNFVVTVSASAGTYECANKTVLLDNTETYLIEFEVQDLFTSETTTVVVSEGIPIMFLSSTNKNVGIGTQNSHEEYSLEVENNVYCDSVHCDTIHCNNYDGPSYVVNSLSGSSTTEAPSVKAVNDGIKTITKYSNAETKVGYVENKPLYRKLVEITNLTIGSQYNSSLSTFGINNVDKVLRMEGYEYNSSFFIPLSEYISFSNYLYIQSGAFMYKPGFAENIRIIIEYTKTTD